MVEGEHRKAASWMWLAILALLAALQGCSWLHSRDGFSDELAHYQQLLERTTYEDAACASPATTATAGPPITIDDDAPRDYWNLTLQEAVELALANSTVIRELGGALVRTPDLLETIHQPSIRETDPILGPEAALSEFDAVFSRAADCLVTLLVEGIETALNRYMTTPSPPSQSP